MSLKEGLNTSIGGSLLAVMNTGSEYGFGGVIAALPGFASISSGIGSTFTNPLSQWGCNNKCISWNDRFCIRWDGDCLKCDG